MTSERINLCPSWCSFKLKNWLIINGGGSSILSRKGFILMEVDMEITQQMEEINSSHHISCRPKEVGFPAEAETLW